ncbi:MAG: class I SAM-dependent rRNA methyltransferase [Candidatus Hydrogenedens sp.]
MNKHIPTACIKENEEKRILRGHLWVYKNEILKYEPVNDGDIVDIYNLKGRFICRGFYQAEGNIFARVLTYHQEEINTHFFLKRLSTALHLRNKLFSNSDIYRWIHAESDKLPGLIVDRYQSIVIINSQCKFYNVYSHYLLEAIKKFEGIQHVYNKLQEDLFPDIPNEIVCNINKLNIIVPIKKAQKTGLFLDQRLNYLYSQKYTKEAKILDCFCYVGLWTCHSIQAGAKYVIGVDSSKEAIDIAKKNLEINKYIHYADFYNIDVEEYFQQNLKEDFDVIILDPPAYAKKKNDFKKAFLKYQRINSIAMKHIKKGGFLITCSCSHFISFSDFREIIKRASRNESRDIRLLEQHGASPDHPEILIMPELSYLKCAIFQVF